MRLVFSLAILALAAHACLADVHDNGDGTVSDGLSGLRWTQEGNGEEINHPDSVVFCEKSSLAGFDDWRLPTLEEAITLFRPEGEPKNRYRYRDKDYPLRIDDAFRLSAPGIWTSSASYRGQPTAYLYSSGKEFSWRGDNKNFQRVLCVRPD